jgi:hypothetical protein
MKIKTVVFSILWVGNSFTLRTISGQDPGPASPPSFPSRLDDVDLVSQAFRVTAAQKEQARQLEEAPQPQ